ncbi:hypothetical protein D3C84_1233560 [compost metagenome]
MTVAPSEAVSAVASYSSTVVPAGLAMRAVAFGPTASSMVRVPAARKSGSPGGSGASLPVGITCTVTGVVL